MRWRRIKAVVVKESLQILRDPRSLMIVLLIPLMQMFMLGYGVNLDVRHIPLCAYDREGSQASRDLLQRFSASPYFTLLGLARGYGEIRRDLDSGRCRLAIVIPEDFSKGLRETGQGRIQALLDATDSNTANLAANYARSVVARHGAGLRFESTPTGPPGGAVEVRARVWFNEDLVSRHFIVPGIVALVMGIVGAQLTSLTIAREWERGTMELLISTPLQPMELMLGKLLPYFIIGMVDACICLTLAIFWFEVPFRGTLSALFFTTGLFLTVVLCIGYFVSVSIRSQVGASQVALLVTMLPTTLLSGFTFPIDQMPAPIQAITYLVSGRYFVTLLKALFLKGAPWNELLAPILCLTAYAIVMVVLAARSFRKTLD